MSSLRSSPSPVRSTQAGRDDTPPPASSVLDLIGRTPLVRLRHFERETPGVELYAKAEWQNPGGSVKDRAAARMIADGEASGALVPGLTSAPRHDGTGNHRADGRPADPFRRRSGHERHLHGCGPGAAPLQPGNQVGLLSTGFAVPRAGRSEAHGLGDGAEDLRRDARR